MKQLIKLTGLVAALLLLPFSTANAQQEVALLPDLELFTDTQYAGWAGSGLGLTLVLQNGFIPVDEGNRYKNNPSMKFEVQGPENSGGWFQAILAGNDWETYNIAPYMQNGTLNFMAKGIRGTETFTVELTDSLPGRTPKTISTNAITIGPISTDWQQISIPLSSFTSQDGTAFEPSQMGTIGIGSANTNPHTFWLADIRITSPDPELTYPPVKVNQVGYRPDGLKQALISDFPERLPLQDGDPFTLQSVDSGAVVYEGTLELIADLDPIASGEKVLLADFTEFDQAGSYILTAGNGTIPPSVPFEISPDVFDSLLIDTTRYLYLQRSGIPLEAQYAGQFARSTGHPQDAQAEFRSGAFGPRDVSGGWYDAGDYGKYVNAGATTISDLLWAYELFPNQFPDNHLNIPESGNGVSDLIDEIRWELDWMLKMQDPDSGGFYHMVQPTDDVTPNNQEGPRYIEDAVNGLSNVRPSAGTASAVAAMAHASLIYEAIDPDYAATLRTAAENGYTYLRANPSLVQPVDGAYADWDDSDNRFWAATAMYRLTGDESYHNDVRSSYQTVQTKFRSTNDNGYGVQDMGMVAWLSYVYSDNQDPAVRGFFEDEFSAFSEHMIGRWEDSTWNHTLLDEDYYWGSNYVALTTPLVMYTAQRALGQSTEVTEQISQQAIDYLLGSNPLNLSYVSGFGENSIRKPHSANWSHDGIVEVPAGILAGGPNEYNNPLFYTQFPAKSFLDSPSSWTTNEHTIYWNSALIFHAALQADPPVVEAVAEPIAAQEEPVGEADSANVESEDIVEESVDVPEEVAEVVAEAPAERVVEEIETAADESAIQSEAEAVELPSGFPLTTVIIAAVGGALLMLIGIAVGFRIARRN